MPGTPTVPDGLRYPVGGDTPNIPRDIQNLAVDTQTALLKRAPVDTGVQRFATAAARTAAIASPIAGMLTWLDDVKRLEVYKNGAWTPASQAIYCDLYYGNFTGAPAALTWSMVNPLTMGSQNGGFILNGGVLTVPFAGRYLIDAGVHVTVGQHYVELSPGGVSSQWASTDSFFAHTNASPTYGTFYSAARAYNLTAGHQVAFWMMSSAANKGYGSILAKFSYLGQV